MSGARRAVVVALVAGASCHRPAPLPPLTTELLTVASTLGDATVNESARPTLAALGAQLRTRLARPGATPAAALVATLFDAPAFAREVDDPDLRFVLLPTVLAARRGSCVGLGTLALALAELAGVSARGVVAPGHFYVEVAEGAHWRRVELLKSGAELPDDWYRARYGTPGRAVTPREVLGVVAYDVGNARRKQGRLVEARAAYARAVADFPTFAEAHASLGATLQMLGALDDAAAAYARARALAPNLAGLDGNVALLDAERAKRYVPDAGAPTRP